MVDVAAIAEAVGEAAVRVSHTLRPDVLSALEAAAETEPSPRGRAVLAQLVSNARVAERDRVPLCQDTGTVRVTVELGADERLDADLQAGIDRAVAAAWADHALRASTVRDALCDRSNPGDDTPAFVELRLRPGSGATVHVTLKGGGSDNASVLAMLDPAEGSEGVRRVVLETVEAKATGACPPLVVGVGVGGTFDTVAALSRRALSRRIDEPGAGMTAAFEAELLTAVNATGIGPAGLGGRTTALAVMVESAPCHIAALPVAVNLGCCAMRSATVEVR